MRSERRTRFSIAIRTALTDCRPQNCERNAPQICWHTILTCGNPQWYGQAIETAGAIAYSPIWSGGDGPIKTFALRGAKDNPPYMRDERLLTLEVRLGV